MSAGRMQELLIDALKTDHGGALAGEIVRRGSSDPAARREWRRYLAAARRQVDALIALRRLDAGGTARHVARERAQALAAALETELYGGAAAVRHAECAASDEGDVLTTD